LKAIDLGDSEVEEEIINEANKDSLEELEG